MESTNPIFKKPMSEIEAKGTDASSFKYGSPEPDPIQRTIPLPKLNTTTTAPSPEKMAIPTPDMFPIYEGMTEGQLHAQKRLRSLAQFVNLAESRPLTDDERMGAITFFYKEMYKNGTSVTPADMARDLFGVENADLNKAFELVLAHSKKLITLEPIQKYNELTEEERKQQIIDLVRPRGGTEYKFSDWKEYPMGGMYGAVQLNKENAPKKVREEVLKDNSPEAMARNEEDLKARAYTQTGEYIYQILGKTATPEQIDLAMQAGLFDDNEGKAHVLQKIGAKDTPKYKDYPNEGKTPSTKPPLLPPTQGMMGGSGGLEMSIQQEKAFENLTPAVKATILNAKNNSKDNVLDVQNVIDAEILQMPDDTYAAFVKAIDVTQLPKDENWAQYLARSTFSVLAEKWSNIKGYVVEGEGYDIWHLYDNSESIYRKYSEISKGDENPFYPDGSVKTKYLTEAKKMYEHLGELPDSEDKNRKFMSMADWLDHGLHDYYEVGKSNALYERRVRNLSGVIRTNYDGHHGVLLEESGAIFGTLVDMTVTGAIASIPYVGQAIALGTLYASEQYELETQALDAGVRPDQARFWSSFYAIPYALSEYMQVKMLEPKVWSPILKDIGTNPSLLHRSLLVGLGIKAEGEAFTTAELKLLRKAKNLWGFKNYIKVTTHETGEEFVQAGYEYAYWATLALSNPNNVINLKAKEIQMYQQMLGAVIIMPFVTFAGIGIARLGYRGKTKTKTIDELNKLTRDQALLTLANNSAIQQLEKSGELKEESLPSIVLKMVDTVFGVNETAEDFEKKKKTYVKGRIDWKNEVLKDDENIRFVEDDEIEEIAGRINPETGEIEGGALPPLNENTTPATQPSEEDLSKEEETIEQGEKRLTAAKNLLRAKLELEAVKRKKSSDAVIRKAEAKLEEAREAYAKEDPNYDVKTKEAKANLQEAEKEYRDAQVEAVNAKDELDKTYKNEGDISTARAKRAEALKKVELAKSKVESARDALNEIPENLQYNSLLEKFNQLRKLRESLKERKNISPSEDDTIEHLRESLLKAGYMNPDEIIFTARRVLQLQKEVIDELKTQLSQSRINLDVDALTESGEVQFQSKHARMAPAERLHQIFKAMGSDVELDIVENPAEAADKYGMSESDLDSQTAFFHSASKTIVMIASNISNEAMAEEKYIHEATHSSKAFENRVANMAFDALIELTDATTDEELNEKAKELLRTFGGMTDEQMSKMSDTELYSELGAVIISQRVLNKGGKEADELFQKMVEALQSKYSLTNMRQFFEAIVLMSRKGQPNAGWSLSEDRNVVNKRYMLKVLAMKLAGLDMDINTTLESLNLSKEEAKKRAEQLGMSIDEYAEAMEFLDEKAKKEGWDEKTTDRVRDQLFNAWESEMGWSISEAEEEEEANKKYPEGVDSPETIDTTTDAFIENTVAQVKESTGLKDESVIKRVILEALNSTVKRLKNDKNLPEYESRTPSEYLNAITEEVVKTAISELEKGENPASRSQALDATRELAIRMVEMTKNKKPESEAIAEGTAKETIKAAKEHADKIREVMKKRNIKSPREAEIWATALEIVKNYTRGMGLARENATIKVIDEAQERVKINRHLRLVARRVLSSVDIREFNNVTVALSLDEKIKALIENHAPEVVIEKEIRRVYNEYLEKNAEKIGEIVERMKYDKTIPEEEFDVSNTKTGSILDTPAGIAVSRELVKGVVEEFKKYTPTRAKLISNAMRSAWMAKTRADLIEYATAATSKVAYRPIDKDAQIAMKDLLNMSSQRARNLPWYKRKLTKENLGKVRRWKKLYNMSRKKADAYIQGLTDELHTLVNNENATTQQVKELSDKLVEAQKFAGLSHEPPSAYTDAMDYALEQLDEESQKEAQKINEEFANKKTTVLNRLKTRKGKHILGLNSMNFYDVLRSIFGTAEDVTQIQNELRNLTDEGTEKAAQFKLKYGADTLFDKMTARTGLKTPAIRKRLREMTKADPRFDGCLLSDKNLPMSADEALYAYMSWTQEDQRSKAEVTFDMDRIRIGLTDFEMELGEVMKELYQEAGEELSVAVEEKTGLRFVSVANYSPIRLATDRSPSAGKTVRANIVPLFVLQRTDNSKLLEKVGAMQVFESHMADGAVFVGMFDATMLMNQTFLDPEVLRMVENKYGADAEKVLREFGISVATQRTSRNATLQSESKTIRALLALQITPILWNPRSALRQVSSLPLYGLENDVNIGETILQRLGSMFSPEYKEAKAYIKNSAVIQERINTALSRETGFTTDDSMYAGEEVANKIISSGLKMNKKMDMITVMFVAPVVFQNFVDKLNEQGAFGGDQEKVKQRALAQTLGRINATQQSTQIAYRSYSHLYHGNMRAIIAPFSSTLQQFASFELQALHQFREAKSLEERMEALKKLSHIFFLNRIVSAPLYTILGELWKYGILGDDWDDDSVSELVMNLIISMLIGPLAGIYWQGTMIKASIETAVRVAYGEKAYPTDMFGGVLNTILNPANVYKNMKEFGSVAKEASWSDPEDVVKVLFEATDWVPAANQTKKIVENRIWDE